MKRLIAGLTLLLHLVGASAAVPYIFATMPSGNVPATYLDTDFAYVLSQVNPTVGNSILYGNGLGGFANVTIGTNLQFAGGVLSATGAGTGTVTSVAFINNSTAGPQFSVATSTSTPSISTSKSVGYLEIPQNSQSANYTTVLNDSGGQIFHPASDANARTFTIAANASVAYPIGTAITFINMSANSVTIAINSDTLYLGGTGSTGSRTLTQYGSATAIKIGTTSWLITGSGLT